MENDTLYTSELTTTEQLDIIISNQQKQYETTKCCLFVLVSIFIIIIIKISFKFFGFLLGGI